jgi:hypothetical protein
MPRQPFAPSASAAPSAMPTGRASGWSTRNVLLLGTGLGLLIAMLGVTFVLVGILWLRPPASPPQQLARNDLVSVDEPDPSDPVESTPSVDLPDPPDPPEPAESPAAVDPSDLPDPGPLMKTGGESASTDVPEVPTPGDATPGDDTPFPSPSPPPKPKKPFDDIRERNYRLPLPKRDLPQGKVFESVELAKLFVDSAENCSLTIIGSDKVLGGKGAFFTESKNGSQEQRSWDVRYKSGGLGRATSVGTFTLSDQALSFQWDDKTENSPKPGKLQYCLLEIKVGEERQKCILSTPSEAEPLTLHLALKNRNRLTEIPIPSENIPDKKFLRLDLKLEGFPAHTLSNASGLKVGTGNEGEAGEKGDFCTIKISGGEGDDHKENFLTVQLELVYDAPSAKGEYVLRPRVFMELLEWRRMKTSASAKEIVETALPKPEEKLIEITADSEETIPKAWSGSEVATYEQEVSTKQNFVEASKLELDEAEARERTNIHFIVIKQLTIRYEANKKVLGNLKDRIKTANRNRQRWEKMPKLVDTIKNEGRVHFRVYAMIEGEEVDVMHSSGFPE